MWVPVALSRDVPAGVTRAVILEGEERVVWRGADGSVQIWEDRCPHRGMRLSFGFVRENTLNCLYHGWQYSAASHCVRIPAHPDLEVPSTIRATVFPAAEAAGMIWTRRGGDMPLPVLPDAVPVATLAVEASDKTILALCNAVPEGTAQVFVSDTDDLTFTIGWHTVNARKTMIHAALANSTDVVAGLVALRKLRSEAELRSAA
jgi:phenylpropionate dioxygenase-like ring-hydroxylating dioxygenase large terminal subunit